MITRSPRSITLLLSLVLVAASTALAAPTRPAVADGPTVRATFAPADSARHEETVCERDEVFRQFDFWLGDWDVYDPSGQHVGRNEITKLPGGCALLESWEGDRGSVGNSINFYDPAKKAWTQTWVGGTAYVIEVEGQLVDGAMRLEGRYALPDGVVQPFRATWTPLEDGRVRQFLETSSDSGATFQTWFDGYYVRRTESP